VLAEGSAGVPVGVPAGVSAGVPAGVLAAAGGSARIVLHDPC